MVKEYQSGLVQPAEETTAGEAAVWVAQVLAKGGYPTPRLKQNAMNRAIVINSFGRGGSNILANMIGSSPSVVMPAKEFWQFYYGGLNLPPKVYRRVGIEAGKLASRSMFSAGRFRKRLERSIQDSLATDYQLRKQRGIGLEFAERVLVKVTEYDIFLNAQIEEQFDETVFIGLVRNGYGLCDSWKRRGMPARMAGKVYGHIAGQMAAELNSRKNYLLVRFEDMVSDPLHFLDQLYARLMLPPPREDSHIHRPKGFGPGQEAAASGARAMRIVDRSYWASLVADNVNGAAIERLTPEELRAFNQQGSRAMEELYEVQWK
jgi:Sulfotransferase family